MRKFIPFVLVLTFLPLLIHAQHEDRKIQIRAFYDQTLSNRQSYQWLEDLCSLGPRLSGSEGSLRAIEWMKGVMDTCGFDRVYLQPVKVPHWERGIPEKAEILDSRGLRYDLNVLAIGGSVATPEGGILASVVEVPSLMALEDLEREEVEGKIVFFNSIFDQTNISPGASYGAVVASRAEGAIRAARKGAVASIIRSVSSGFDDVPHTGSGHYEASTDSIPAAALGVQSADLLHQILLRDPLAKVYLSMHCRWHPDTESFNVIAEITGNERPDQIIVMGGHLDSWDVGVGAHDDGAGCMHTLGALKLLLDQGVRPKHTVRAVMFMNEENGLRGGITYAEQAISNGEEHIVAIESDAGGYSPRGFGVSGNASQMEKLESWVGLFPRNTISYISRGGGGADIGPLNRADGTPMIGLIVDGQKMFDLHHSANDVFEAVHPRELELGTASIATLVYLIDQYGL
ncbi:MAG: M20/M25/M40 family metallo-hydrolase [Saprospiraceae bacterium]|nr:M20/M25/M40 family metallo-hydrolase [Saprospiraceae bacterium]